MEGQTGRALTDDLFAEGLWYLCGRDGTAVAVCPDKATGEDAVFVFNSRSSAEACRAVTRKLKPLTIRHCSLADVPDLLRQWSKRWRFLGLAGQLKAGKIDTIFVRIENVLEARKSLPDPLDDGQHRH